RNTVQHHQQIACYVDPSLDVLCSVVMTEIKYVGATLRLTSRNFKFHYESEDADIGFELQLHLSDLISALGRAK
ncbi:hypothetical protein Tco_0721895, partial [Tanacetum coccineum]